MAAAPQPNELRRLRRSAQRDHRHGPVGNSGRLQSRSPRRRDRSTDRSANRNIIRLPFLARRTAAATKVTTLPSPSPAPQWLEQLRQVYRWSSVAVLGLGVAVAGVYGQTVRLEQDLGKTYGRLQGLQRQERELTVAMEQLKDQIARQATQAGSGLALPTPKDQIFLEPTPAPGHDQPRPNSAPVLPQQGPSDVPVGY